MKTLKMGDKGSLISMLQLALTRAKIFEDVIDGIFNESTKNAVISYQQSNELIPDGVVGRDTWDKLKEFIRGYVNHIVRAGDTFISIAKMHDSKVEDIVTANPYISPLNIPIGAKLVVPLNYPAVPTNIPYSYELLKLVADGLGARYPFLSVMSISRSVMGKLIYCISIGNGKKQISWNGSHHANEWITTPVLLKFIDDYSKAYSKGEKIFNIDATELYNNTKLFVVPMVNPDGVDLVTGALSDGPYYENAKSIANNYPDIPFPDGWKANILGTDINLNYPAGWENAKEIKYSLGFKSPAPRDFVGTAPLSAPESRTMYEFTQLFDFLLILAYHTQGEVIYWKYLDYDPPKALEIGQKLSEASGYTLEFTPYNSSFAGYKDWFIQDYNRPGYTVEAGLGNNPLPISQFDKIYSDNVGLLAVSLNEI